MMRILGSFAFALCMTVATANLFGQETSGIGAALRKDGDGFIVHKILPDSPAALNKSPAVGDRIISVGDQNKPLIDVNGLSLSEVVQLIRGPKGTEVRLTIVPAGKDDSQALAVSITRGELKELARWGDGRRLTKGTQAPNIEMTRLSDMKSERLAEHLGKVVVLKFWSTWCGPCQKSVDDLQSCYEQYPDWKNKVVLIAASVDDEADLAAKHATDKKWDKTHNVWVGVDAIKAWHVNSLPSTYVIDQQGNVASYDPEEGIAEVVNRLIRGE